MDDLNEQNIAQAEEINNLERITRRNNNRIVGVPTKANENCHGISQDILKEVLRKNVFIERSHRDGQVRVGKDRRNLLKLSNCQDKVPSMKNSEHALTKNKLMT